MATISKSTTKKTNVESPKTRIGRGSKLNEAKTGSNDETAETIEYQLSTTDWKHIETQIKAEILTQNKTLGVELNTLKESLNDHLQHHRSTVFSDLHSGWQALGRSAKILGGSIFVIGIILVTFYAVRSIQDIVNSTINDRQCVPDKPIVSAGAFCIK